MYAKTQPEAGQTLEILGEHMQRVAAAERLLTDAERLGVPGKVHRNGVMW